MPNSLPSFNAFVTGVPFDQSRDDLLQGVALRFEHIVLCDAVYEREEDSRLHVRVFHPDFPEVVLQPTSDNLGTLPDILGDSARRGGLRPQAVRQLPKIYVVAHDLEARTDQLFELRPWA